MEIVLIVALFFLVLYMLNRIFVVEFKNTYYKQKLECRGIKSSVEDVNTILDIIRK